MATRIPRFVPATKCAALAIAAHPKKSILEIALLAGVSERTVRRVIDAAANGKE